MSSPKDTLLEAVERNRTLAARLLVHAQDLAAQLAKTEATIAEMETAPSDVVAALRLRLDEQRTQLEDAQREYQAVLGELDALKKLMKDVDHNVAVADLVVPQPGDPLSNMAVDQTLARVREHVAQLDAQASLGRDLARPATAPTESPEEKARRQLEELKAARDRKKS